MLTALYRNTVTPSPTPNTYPSAPSDIHSVLLPTCHWRALALWSTAHASLGKTARQCRTHELVSEHLTSLACIRLVGRHYLAQMRTRDNTKVISYAIVPHVGVCTVTEVLGRSVRLLRQSPYTRALRHSGGSLVNVEERPSVLTTSKVLL